MKKTAILLIIVLCLALCGCPAEPEKTTPVIAKEVHITAGKIETGMTVKDVLVEVTIDKQPVKCRLELTCFTQDGYYTMAEDETVSENFCVRLDVFYSLPAGYDVDDINVTMECNGGEYDGTGSISVDDNGCIEAWSHAFYGELPEETNPVESTENPQPTVQPQTTEPAKTAEPTSTIVIYPQTHIHSWELQNSGNNSVSVSCTTDFVKIYSCTCGETKKETVPAQGHDMKDGAISKPSCTDNGRQTKSCSRCSYAIVVEIPATGHTWSDWENDTGRVHKHTCSTCGAVETENHSIPSGDVICTGCGAAIIN